MKTCLYNFDPLKRHFYIVKLGLIGVYIFFISAQNIDYGYSLESPNYTVPTIYVFSRNMKIFIFFFLPENFRFLVIKFSVYLNRHVFVMICLYMILIFILKKIHGKVYIKVNEDTLE